MNPMLAAGLVIGLACALWMFVMGLTGWYTDPVLRLAFFAVVPIEVAGLVWGLRRTAPERGYMGQIVAGTMIAIVAGVVIIGSSLLFTTVAFPRYFDEIAQAQREMLERRNVPAAEIERQVEETRAASTPMGQALEGFLGTLVTGILASAVIAVGVRRR